MKTRFFPLAAVGLTLATVAGTAFFAGQSALDIYQRTAEQRAGHDQGQDIPDVDRDLMEAMERLYPLIGGISRPDRQALGGDVRFQLLGFDADTVARHEEEAVPDDQRFDRHVVEMTYISPRRSFAVIDGRLYTVGDTITGSEGRVRTITPDRVLIAGRRARQWVDVDNRGADPLPAPGEPDMAGGRTPPTAREEAEREERRERERADPDADELQEVMQGVEALRALQPDNN